MGLEARSRAVASTPHLRASEAVRADQRLDPTRWRAIAVGEVVFLEVGVAEAEAALIALVLQALAALWLCADRDRVRALARSAPRLVFLHVAQLAAALSAGADVHVVRAALAVTLAEGLAAVDARGDGRTAAGATQ